MEEGNRAILGMNRAIFWHGLARFSSITHKGRMIHQPRHFLARLARF